MIVHRTPFHIRALKRHVPLPLVYFDNYDNGNCRKINTYYGSIKRNHNLKLTRIIEETEKEFGGKPEFTRKTAIYRGHQYSGRSLRKIGEKFGIGESAVSQASRRIAWEMMESRTLRRRVEGVIKRLLACQGGQT